MLVLKSEVVNVAAIASACEESYKTGLPVQLSLKHNWYHNWWVVKLFIYNNTVEIAQK